MAIIWKPNGTLDVNSELTDLPETSSGSNYFSEALGRSTNIRLDKRGMVLQRYGSSKYNTSALTGITDYQLSRYIDGHRYAFYDRWYRDEAAIDATTFAAGGSLTDLVVFRQAAETTPYLYSVFYNESLDLQYTFRIDLTGTDLFTTINTIGIDKDYWWSAQETQRGVLGLEYRAIPVTDSELSIATGVLIALTWIRKESGSVVYESNPFVTLNISGATTGTLIWIDPLLASNRENNIDGIRVYRTVDGTYTVDYETTEEEGEPKYFEAEFDLDFFHNGSGASDEYDYAYCYDWEYTSGHVSGDLNKIGTEETTNIVHTGLDLIDSTATFETQYNGFQFGAVCFMFEPIPFHMIIDEDDLGAQMAINHDLPPNGIIQIAGPAYNGTVFAVVDNKLYYTLPGYPEYWPVDYYTEIGNPIEEGKAVVFHNSQLYWLSEQNIYLVQGTTPDTFFPINTEAKAGAVSKNGVVSVHGYGIFHVAYDGIYLYSGADSKITEQAFDVIFKGDESRGVAAVSPAILRKSVIRYHNNRIYFFYWDDATTPTETNCLVWYLETKRVTFYAYPFVILDADSTSDGLVCSCYDGYSRLIESTANSDDSGTDVSWEIQTKEFILSTRSHYPRWNKYDVDASSATSVTASSYLDDAAIKVHTITGDRDDNNAKRRLMPLKNGNRFSVKLSGSGEVSIYGIECE